MNQPRVRTVGATFAQYLGSPIPSYFTPSAHFARATDSSILSTSPTAAKEARRSLAHSRVAFVCGHGGSGGCVARRAGLQQHICLVMGLLAARHGGATDTDTWPARSTSRRDGRGGSVDEGQASQHHVDPNASGNDVKGDISGTSLNGGTLVFKTKSKDPVPVFS